MSQKQGVILNTPARKVFASQLHNDNIHTDSSSQVWVQGIVVLVSADGNDLFLDDGTGIIQANGVTKIVKDLFIQKGAYSTLYLPYIIKVPIIFSFCFMYANQAFSQTLKTGHPEGMFSHKIK